LEKQKEKVKREAINLDNFCLLTFNSASKDAYSMKTFKSAVILTSLVLIFFFSLLQNSLAQNPGNISQSGHLMRITEGLGTPLRIAIDNRDAIYVTDAVGGRVCKYDSSGAFSGELITGCQPLAIAVSPQGSLYISDRVSGNILHLDSSGVVLNSFGNFELPSSMAIDDENRLYVADGKQKKVSVFDSGGNLLHTFGDSILIFPTGTAFDPVNQRILIAEHGGLVPGDSTEPDAKIHVFDLQGTWLTSFGEYGHEEGQFTRIQGLAVDTSGRIYVADPFQGIVTGLDENGVFLVKIGQFGSAPGELKTPMDAAIDSRNRLWVTSMNNGALEVYDIDNIPTNIVDNTEPILPTRSELLQNYPNPFNPGTWIPFILGGDDPAVINIYNLLGQRIRSFDLGKRQRGRYLTKDSALYWDGTNNKGSSVASGIYFYELRSGDFTAVKRMLLLK
jgi:DNA-binding beta-propeller fold protein YncE